MKRIATLCGLFVAGALVFSSCNEKEDNENNDFQSEQVQTYYLYDMFEDLQCESLKYGHDIANNTCFTINSKEEFLELCSDGETADSYDFQNLSMIVVKTSVQEGIIDEPDCSHAYLQKIDDKNILVLQNWLERIRKEVTNKVLSIKRISDFLNFPILAQPTLKKI